MKFCRKEIKTVTSAYQKTSAEKNSLTIKLDKVQSTSRTNENENNHQQDCKLSTNSQTVTTPSTEYQNYNPYLIPICKMKK